MKKRQENAIEQMEKKIERTVFMSEWINPEADIYDGDRIAFRAGEMVVCGEVSLSPRSISVKMTSPMSGPSLTDTMDADMPVIFIEDPLSGQSPASPVGKYRARRLLVQIYCSLSGSTL